MTRPDAIERGLAAERMHEHHRALYRDDAAHWHSAATVYPEHDPRRTACMLLALSAEKQGLLIELLDALVRRDVAAECVLVEAGLSCILAARYRARWDGALRQYIVTMLDGTNIGIDDDVIWAEPWPDNPSDPKYLIAAIERVHAMRSTP